MGSDSSMSNDLASLMLALIPMPQTMNPSSGAIGLTMTIVGSGMSSVTGVQVGGMPSLSVVVVDDTKITALVPTLSLGSKPVMLLSPNGNVTTPTNFTVTL